MASLICLSQQNPHVHWRFVNEAVVEEGGELFLIFDVEVSCDKTGTYHSDMQVYINYNTLAFGENVVASGNIVVEKADLLLGDFGGTPLYVTYPPGSYGADNQNNRHAILTEAQFPVPSPAFAHEVPILPAWGKLLSYKLRIQDDTQLAGIEFVPAILTNFMNGGQYYVDQDHPSPTKYGDPPNYEGVYENDLLDFALSVSGMPGLKYDKLPVFYYADKLLIFENTDSTEFQLTVFDINGRMALNMKISPAENAVVPVSLPAGIYLAKAVFENGTVSVKFFANEK